MSETDERPFFDLYRRKSTGQIVEAYGWGDGTVSWIVPHGKETGNPRRTGMCSSTTFVKSYKRLNEHPHGDDAR